MNRNSLSSDDEMVLEICVNILKELIARRNELFISQEQIISLRKALYICSQFPKFVIEGSITITATEKWPNNSTNWCSFILASNYFEMCRGWYDNESEDSNCTTLYSTQVKNELCDDILFCELDSWKEEFFHRYNGIPQNLSIEDNAQLLES